MSDDTKEWALGKAKDEEGFDITAGYQKIDTIMCHADFLATYPWGNLTEAQAALIAEGAGLIKAIAADVACHVAKLTRDRDQLLRESEAFQIEVRSALGCPDDGVPFVEHIKRMRAEVARLTEYHQTLSVLCRALKGPCVCGRHL